MYLQLFFQRYFGTDGNTPSGQYDFVTVVLHELGHGLGFLGSANMTGATGFLGLSGYPIVYDLFVEQLNGTDLTSLTSGTTTLGSALTSNNLYWNGPEGMAENGGIRPRIYAPTSWAGGSSYSHLNEGTYPAGNVNSLMTPFIGSAEANHNPRTYCYGYIYRYRMDRRWLQYGVDHSWNAIRLQPSDKHILAATNP